MRVGDTEINRILELSKERELTAFEGRWLDYVLKKQHELKEAYRFRKDNLQPERVALRQSMEVLKGHIAWRKRQVRRILGNRTGPRIEAFKAKHEWLQ